MPYTGGLNATIDGIKILVFGIVSGITAVITFFYGAKLLAAMVSKFNIYIFIFKNNYSILGRKRLFEWKCRCIKKRKTGENRKISKCN